LTAYEHEVIKILLNAEALSCEPGYQPRKGAPSAHSVLGELHLPLEGLIDVSAEKGRLTKELARIEGEIQKVESKLNNSSFVEKAPLQVLEEHKKRLADWQAKRDHGQAALRSLGEN
jgi:valyl-tRNA synthetase